MSTKTNYLKAFFSRFAACLPVALFAVSAAAAPLYAQGTWTQVYHQDSHASETIHLNSVAYGNGIFVAGGNAKVGSYWQPIILKSSDGRSWSEVTPSNLSSDYTYLTKIKYLNNQFVLLGTNRDSDSGWTDYVIICTSTDGETWPFLTLSGIEWYNNTPRNLTFGSGTYVMSNESLVFYSFDLQAWAEATTPVNGYWDGVAFGNNKFVLDGWMSLFMGSNENRRLVSPDAITWSRVEDEVIPGGNVEYLNGSFIAHALDVIASSPDGDTWQDISAKILTNGKSYAIDYANDHYVITGGSHQDGNYGGYILISSDQQTWWKEKTSAEHEGAPVSITHNESAFVAAGGNGQILYSPFTSTDQEALITSSAGVTGSTGQAFNYQITSNVSGVTYYGRYNLDAYFYDLPEGLSFDSSTGIFSGTPKEAGVVHFIVSAENRDSSAGSRSVEGLLTITISDGASTTTSTASTTTTTIVDTSTTSTAPTTTSTIVDTSTTSTAPTTTSTISVCEDGGDINVPASTSYWSLCGSSLYSDGWSLDPGAWVEDSVEGLVLHGSEWHNGCQDHENNYCDGSCAVSSAVYDFIGTTSYITFRVHGAGFLSVSALPLGMPMQYGWTTDHTWAGSYVIPDDTELYSRIVINEDKSWNIVLAQGGYDDQGGTILDSQSGTLTEEQYDTLTHTQFKVSFNDNYGGSSAYVVIGEARVEGICDTSTTTTTIVDTSTTTTIFDTSTTTVPVTETTTTTTAPDDGECAVTFILGDDDPRLDTIRRFRDEVLATNAVGKLMIDQYYKKDKKVSAMMEKSPILRATAKKIVESLIPAMELMLE